jgi:hypothetical protein
MLETLNRKERRVTYDFHSFGLVGRHLDDLVGHRYLRSGQ